MNTAPPKGVIALSARASAKVKIYKLPENSGMPATNSHPAARIAPDARRVETHATASRVGA